MTTCPECGERVPFGGGKTVNNAHLMFTLARRIREVAERADPDGSGDYSFIDEGERLARSLHDYGHKLSTGNPNWEAAGAWTRVAREAVDRLPSGRQDRG